MEFRPCIDIHDGKVKQIVGGSLSETDGASLVKENFVAEQEAPFFAEFYKKKGIRGGHVILLNGKDTPAFEETKKGNFKDKISKNIFASKNVFDSIKNEKTVGIINENKSKGVTEIADPLGVIAGVTPVTNPTSTVIFKALICAKTRNPIIFGFHPGARNCCIETAKLLRDAAVSAGAPEDLIQWIKEPSIEATSSLMNHPGVAVVLATGGSAMVKSAYSTGKPALGVGPGNVPCYIEKTANVQRAKMFCFQKLLITE